jgi:glucose-1-phosphate thymidylyltransferase
LKGIILAGGAGSRLRPVTSVISKQLLPVYDKPMVYYPLSVLILAGITDILLISTPMDMPIFQRLLGNGHDYGVSINYAEQLTPAGLAEAFLIGESFIGNDNVCLILGDNIFHGSGFSELLAEAVSNKSGATIFAYQTADPSRFGVVDFDEFGIVLSIEEKPEKPKSDFAVTGIYFYDNQVIDIVKNIEPSARGELEITDVNNAYLKMGTLNAKLLGRGFTWADTGTFDSLLDASALIKAIQATSGVLVGCPEEVAFRSGLITRDLLMHTVEKYSGSPYGLYLKNLGAES